MAFSSESAAGLALRKCRRCSSLVTLGDDPGGVAGRSWGEVYENALFALFIVWYEAAGSTVEVTGG